MTPKPTAWPRASILLATLLLCTAATAQANGQADDTGNILTVECFAWGK